MNIFINTYGAYLHVKDEMFEIRVKPDPKAPYRVNHIAAHKIKSFLIGLGTSMSTNAIDLAMKHHIDIVIVNRQGMPLGRFWHAKLGSTTAIRKKQLEASLNEIGLHYVKKWVARKLEHQADFIQDLRKNRPKMYEDLGAYQLKILGFWEKIKAAEGKNPAEVADKIRGWEGSAGRQYFAALSLAIPSTFKFQGRSMRPAKDAFNACLNYAYGILYSRVEKSLMIAGLDPYLGFLHRDDYNLKSLVFDFIEPYRIYADKCVFWLFSRKKIKKSFFESFQAGITLNKDGKQLLVESFQGYLENTKRRLHGRNQTYANAMQMEAHRFANELIEKEEDNDNMGDVRY